MATSQSVLQILIKLKDQASKELSKFDKTLSNVGKVAVGVGTSIAGMAVAVSIALGKAINETVEYGKQVDDLSRALGTSAEEASKLIQVADDLRIDFTALKMGFRFALNEGINPTIGGLKELAAEYQRLPEGTARAQFAMEKFGSRAGLEMQKILELTGKQIDEMTGSFEKLGLVMSEEDVQATKELYAAMDNLSDVFEGFKIQIALGVIPELSDFLTAVFDVVMGIEILQKGIEDNKIGMGEALWALNKLRYGEMDLADIQRFANDQTFSGHKVMHDFAEETTNASDATEELGEDVLTAAEKWREYRRAQEEAINALIEARTEAFFDVDMGFGDTAADAITAIDFQSLGGAAGADLVESIKQAFVTGAITEPEADAYLEKLAVAAAGIQVTLGEVDIDTAVEDLSEQLKKPVEEVQPLLEAELSKPLDLSQMLSSFNEQLKAAEERKAMLVAAGELEVEVDKETTAAGKLTDLQAQKDALTAEADMILNADPQDAARMKIEALYLQLDNLTKEPWVVDVVVNKPDVGGGGGTGGGGGGGGRRGKQYGGYVSPMMPYLVGERGPELFVPNAAGNIVPNNRLRGGRGARGDVYVTQHFHSAGAAALGMAIVDEARGKRLDAAMGG